MSYLRSTVPVTTKATYYVLSNVVDIGNQTSSINGGGGNQTNSTASDKADDATNGGILSLTVRLDGAVAAAHNHAIIRSNITMQDEDVPRFKAAFVSNSCRS